MEGYLSAELTATCAVLGYYDGTNYHLDKYCLGKVFYFMLFESGLFISKLDLYIFDNAINLLIDVIKDLIRYLKRDDDTHSIRRFLGRTKLLQTDLVKILIHHVSNIELWDVLLRYYIAKYNLNCVYVTKNPYNSITYDFVFLFLYRLVINLTSSAFVIYNEQVPTEKTMHNFYQQIISYLHEYKTALTDDHVWLAVAGRLGNLLSIVSEINFLYRYNGQY